jgi:hypothetical protein
MSYIINKSNGSKLVAIEDGSINVNVCDLTLVGKNYAGYGESIATNFVKLLENFSNTKQPSKPLTGQIWYDSGNKKIKFYNGVEFKSVPSLQVSRNFPTDQNSGDLLFNETDSKLYYYNGTEYIPIGPPVTGKAASNTIVPLLLDDAVSGNQRYILGHQLQDPDELNTTIVAVTSDFSITPSLDQYSAPGRFPKIRKGITLRNTDPSTGISSLEGDEDDYLFWGTASDALKLNGLPPSSYVTYAVPIFDNQVQVRNADGININTNGLRLFTNPAGAKITTDLDKVSIDATVNFTLKNIINIDATNNPTPAILPSTTPDTLVDIGSTISPFRNIYATELRADRIYGTIESIAPRATLADTVALTPTNTTNANYYILFTNNASGNGAVQTDTGLTYNPSTNGLALGPVSVTSIIKTGTTNVGDIGQTGNRFANIYGNLIGDVTGNITGSVSGTVSAPSIAKSGVSGTGDIGSSGNVFGTVYATATSARYADLAEKYLADAEYEPGTVLRLGGTAEVTICATYESEAIAGIVSTNPAYLMNDALENGVAIALKGRVPCKVKGAVKKGDVLVSSSTPGHAEVRKYGHRTNPLAVLGKALQDFDGDTGVIEVMVY